jgi:iron(III) transport system permease protein
MDSTLEDAGFASGASRWMVTRRITIPMLTPALMSALIYQFVNVIASFDLPLIIGLRAGIPLLSTEIFANARPLMGIPDFGVAATYSMLLLALALGPLIVYGRLIGRSERFATISGHGFRPRHIELGRWKVPALLFALVFIVLSFLLPLFILVWMSVQPFYSPPSAESIQRITFEAYQRMVDSPTISPVFLNTFIVCGLTALATMTLGLLVGWLIVRTRSRLRIALDILSFIPNILPGVIIGLSVLLFYFMVPIRLYGTLWIVVVGLTTQLITLATRLMTGSIAQINKQLEEAGSASGAGRWPVLRRIVLPLVRPAFVNGLLLVFLVSMQHLTVPLMLSTPNNTVITAAIYSEWDHGDTSMAGALGVVVVSITVTLAAVLRAFRGALH